ncbi:MAG: slipin family protein, partial [Anaerolineae bacterium]|nr:slipin family protein [Anaerolineae bacterium]
MEFLTTFGVIIVVLVYLLFSAVKIVQEYERGVIFRLGRLVGAKGPGLFFIIPIIDRMVKVDLRTVTLDIPSQEAITKDNVTVRVNAVAYFRVISPTDAIVNVENYKQATWQIAQTSLRSVLGQSELDELLTHREAINHKLQQIIDEATEPWGIKVSIVEIKDVELPDAMKRAMARQAEAEREKRAKIIHAQGELQAAQTLRDAANTIATAPAAIQLRYLQTLTEIAVEKNSTIIFPVPIDFLRAFIQPEHL